MASGSGAGTATTATAALTFSPSTIFQKTRLPLQKWFLAVGLMVNAKKSISSCQLARDLDLNQKSAWFMQQRIRAEMATDQRDLLNGIVEADETYIGGKPRKGNKREDDVPAKRGRGTSKTPVIGAVERHGNVVARAADQPGALTGRGILQFVQGNVDPEASVLITDEFSAYRAVRPLMRHAVINHSQHMRTAIPIPTRLRVFGRWSSGHGWERITTTPASIFRCSLRKAAGNTTTAKTARIRHVHRRVLRVNRLYYGDCLTIMRDELRLHSVDLIYLDPPFNSNQAYNAIYKDETGRLLPDQIDAFATCGHWMKRGSAKSSICRCCFVTPALTMTSLASGSCG